MKNFIKFTLMPLAIMALFSTASLAGRGGNPEIDCARQLRMCLRSCNNLEAQAKRTKAQCERDAYATYPAGSQQLKQALEACRRDYNAAMGNVAECRRDCKEQYDQCSEGEEELPQG